MRKTAYGWASAACVVAAIGFASAAGCSSSTNDSGADGGSSTSGPGASTTSDGGASVPLPSHCMDGQKDNGESDVDCGGSDCSHCVGGKTCSVGSDCASTLCTGGTCTFASSTDGAKNGSETDTDCGGDVANPRCANGKMCNGGGDCTSQECGADKTCSAPSPTDGVKNGGETDTDCGGANTAGSDMAPACGQGKACAANTDCSTGACDPTHRACVPANAMDGVKDGSETDVDCGGTGGAPACGTGKMCGVAADCASDICTGGVCIAASPTDGIKNGGETDTDCGGAATAGSDMAPGCGAGKSCLVHADCLSSGCDDTMHCALAPSCTQMHGGESCGGGETGDPTAAHESCCTSIPVTGYSGGAFKLDKYVITAGRMRQFVDRNNGNIRAYVVAHPPAGWDPTWNSWLPADYNDMAGDSYGGVYTQFGPIVYGTAGAGNEGCYIKGNGARTYREPDNVNTVNFSGDAQYYTQDIDDEKAINCVNWFMVAAFCAWDGGRLPTAAESDFAWTAGSPSTHTYPWGNTPKAAGYAIAYDDQADAMMHPPSSGDVTYANYSYNYWWPSTIVATDYTLYIAAPGRFTKNKGPFGHMDLAGIAMELTGTLTGANGQAPTGRKVTWSHAGSWQGHPIGSAFSFPMTNKYWAATSRCARAN